MIQSENKGDRPPESNGRGRAWATIGPLLSNQVVNFEEIGNVCCVSLQGVRSCVEQKRDQHPKYGYRLDFFNSHCL